MTKTGDGMLWEGISMLSEMDYKPMLYIILVVDFLVSRRMPLCALCRCILILGLCSLRSVCFIII